MQPRKVDIGCHLTARSTAVGAPRSPLHVNVWLHDVNRWLDNAKSIAQIFSSLLSISYPVRHLQLSIWKHRFGGVAEVWLPEDSTRADISDLLAMQSITKL
jgi:hypothetical protein